MLLKEEILKIFEDRGALLKGHFQLSSGLHSDRYLQCALVLQHTEIAAMLCSELAGKFEGKSIDVVVSPAIGGIVVGQELGRALGCRAIFCEKEAGGMVLRRGFKLNEGENALVVEDVITTGGSILKVAETVKQAGANIVGYASIVDRSGGQEDFDLVSLVEVEARTYAPADCPMCTEGLEIQKPGSK